MAPPSATLADLAAAGPGQLRKHEDYSSRYFPTPRTLIVYLPGIYEKNPGLRFPVLYLQDGQNLFDPATSFIPGMYWRVGETADALIARAAIEPLIIVGIYNTGKKRVREYTPSRDRRLGGGGADRYARMLRYEIMPFVESQYRTLGGAHNTALGGSSLGGLLTIYLGLKLPQVFGKLAVLSPALWWNQRWVLDYAARRRGKNRSRVWLDAGTNEGGRTLDDVRRLRDILLQKGWRLDRDLHFEEIQGAQHNEAAWSQRVGPFLQFLFPPRETAV